MSRRYHTILVVPHTRARFQKFRLTDRQLTATALSLLLLLVASAFTTWSFFTTSVDQAELERIRRENEQIRQVNQSFDASIRRLQKRLAEYEDRTRQLALVAGLDDIGRGSEAGVGGDEPPASGLEPTQALVDVEALLNRMTGRLDRVEDRLDERLRWISSTPAVAPVRGLLASGFGYRRDPITGRRAHHSGIDIATAPGQPIEAPGDGVVLRAGRIGGLGNAVYLSHGYGLTTRFGHLSRIGVSAGQRVRRGEVIGAVGTTGRSTGYHLHYEVHVDGRPVNPLGYMLDLPARRF